MLELGGGGTDGWTEVMKGGERAGWTIGGEWADGVSGGSNADQQRARGGWTGGEGSDPDGKAFWQAASPPPLPDWPATETASRYPSSPARKRW